MYVPIELQELILNKSNLKTQIMFISTYAQLYNNLYIAELLDATYIQKSIPIKEIWSQSWSRHGNYKNLLTYDILNQKKFSRLSRLSIPKNLPINMDTNLYELRLTDNEYITDVCQVHCLRILYADGKSAIRQSCIDKLDLFELYCDNNNGIYNVGHMNHLRILSARDRCAISQKCIQKLNLVQLRCCNNYKINDITHMNKLQILYAEGPSCHIMQNSIDNMDLKELYVTANPHIYNVNHLKNLKILRAGHYSCGIKNIDGLNLIELYIGNNYNIKYIPFMNNLRILDISHMQVTHNISPYNLYELRINGNNNIIKIPHMSNLKVLYLNDKIKKIKNLNLYYLCAYNSKIKDLKHMTNLKILYAHGKKNKISYSSLMGLHLDILYAANNYNMLDTNKFISCTKSCILYHAEDSNIDNAMDIISNLKIFSIDDETDNDNMWLRLGLQ